MLFLSHVYVRLNSEVAAYGKVSRGGLSIPASAVVSATSGHTRLNAGVKKLSKRLLFCLSTSYTLKKREEFEVRKDGPSILLWL